MHHYTKVSAKIGDIWSETCWFLKVLLLGMLGKVFSLLLAREAFCRHAIINHYELLFVVCGARVSEVGRARRVRCFLIEFAGSPTGYPLERALTRFSNYSL